MPTWRITAPDNRGKVKKGTSFVVVTRTTGFGPDASDIEEVLYTSGYKERGGSSAISYRAAGNWDCVKISDDTYPAWDEQHERYEEEIKKDKESARREEEQKATKARKESKKDSNSCCGNCCCCCCCGSCIKKILSGLLWTIISAIAVAILASILGGN